jgi:beta-lactamase regulating signal transducer with metallopeptidase domain
VPTDFYHWLILASLKATLILPVAVLAVWVSRRTSSAVITLLLASALLFVPLTPFLDIFPVDWKITLPVLESTEAFPDDIPELLQYEENNPIPIPASEIFFDEAKWINTERVVLILWALGALFFTITRLWKSLNSKLRFSSSTPAIPGDPVLEDFKALCNERHLKRTPWLLYNDSIAGPQTTGVLRPSILVPSTFGGIPQDQRHMVLLHELAHIQRIDIAWRILLEILSIVFWFHPLVWLALKSYDLQVEKACDDAVLHAQYPAAKYGEALLASIKGSAHSRTSAVSSPKQLRPRMFSVVSKDKSRHPLTRQSSWKFALLFLLVIIPVGMVTFSPYHKDLGYEEVDGGDGLKALWRMKIGQGSIIADSSGHERHGKIFGAQWIHDPQRGTCLSFDGKDDHLILRAPDATWTGKPFTFCVWLKPATGSDGGGLLLRGDPNQTWCSAMGSGGIGNLGEREIILAGMIEPGQFDDKLAGLYPAINYWGVIVARTEKALKANEWSHFTLVWRPAGKSALVQLYLNGKPVSTKYLQQVNRGEYRDWPASVWHFGTGESPIAKGNHYEGLVSDLTIYQKALLPKDVKRVMQGDFLIEESFESK